MNSATRKTLQPKVEAGSGSAALEGGGIEKTTETNEREQPAYRRGEMLDVVTMESGASPVHAGGGALPLTLKVQRDILYALITSQRGGELLGLACGEGTKLLLGACGPAEAANLEISCRVGGTVLLLPDMGELLNKHREPNDVHIGMADRAGVPITFGDSAEMVRLTNGH